MLLPYNNEGRGHIGVSFTNCELSGPDQGMTSWRARDPMYMFRVLILL